MCINCAYHEMSKNLKQMPNCMKRTDTTIFLVGQFHWWRKPEYPGESHWPIASHWQTLSYNVISSTPRHERVRTHDVNGDRH